VAKCHNYLKLFKKANGEKLPPHCPSNYPIPLLDRFKPPFGPLYSIYHPELQEVKYWLDKNLSKHLIQTSSSPTATAILFIKKADGSLIFVLDYRGINERTIKNRYPLLLLEDMLVNLSKAK
jgi:hypothetical protein